jgi:putative ABC transport system permease protein
VLDHLATMGASHLRGQGRNGWLGDLQQDARYALRSLRQRAGFSMAVVIVLALGNGATTVMFSVINGVLLTPLAYPHPERLVTAIEQLERATPSGTLPGFSYPNFLDAERASRTVTLAAWRSGGGTVSSPGEAEYVTGALISARLPAVLGMLPSSGRAFLPGEDRPGGPAVAIISHDLWRSRYAGSPSVIGTPLVFEGRAHTVVGVMPAGFQFAGAQVFTPLGQSP